MPAWSAQAKFHFEALSAKFRLSTMTVLSWKLLMVMSAAPTPAPMNGV
jgi:hypothetical protein